MKRKAKNPKELPMDKLLNRKKEDLKALLKDIRKERKNDTSRNAGAIHQQTNEF